MSIVNISSENATTNYPIPKVDGRYDNSEFTVKFKKPLNDCVGVQLLRAAIPLTYNVVNENKDVDGNKLNIFRIMFRRTTAIDGGNGNHVLEQLDGVAVLEKYWNIEIDTGTYEEENAKLEELALQLERKLRTIDLYMNSGTYVADDGKITSGVLGTLGAGDLDLPGWGTTGGELSSAQLQRGAAIKKAKRGEYDYTDTIKSFLCYYDDILRKIKLVHRFKKFRVLGYKFVDKQKKQNENIQKELIHYEKYIGFEDDVYPTGNHHLLNYPTWVTPNPIPYKGDYSYYGSVFNDAVINKRNEQYKEQYDLSYTASDPDPTNPAEVSEAIVLAELTGLLYINVSEDGITAQKSAGVTARASFKTEIINRHTYNYTTPGDADAGWKHIQDFLATKEKSEAQTSGRLQKVFGFYYSDFDAGTSIFINSHSYVLQSHLYPQPRGSKVLFLRLEGPTLDQQNTETNHGDRIMIPITVGHNQVQHYVANTQSEVIPFKVPTNISELKLRLEYGDENSLVGGTSDSLMGYHSYFRFKFYFKHQTNKT